MKFHVEWMTTISELLQVDVDSRILIIDDESIVLSANAKAAAWLGFDSTATGRVPLGELLGPLIAAERFELAREVMRSSTSHSIDGVIQGEGLRCSIRPLPATPTVHRAALLTFQRLCLISENNHSAALATHNDLGDLERLTSRELEVFVLVAQGRSTAKIAYQLRRSRRTIDCHRSAIGQKLQLNSINSWALLALRAGLLRMNYAPRDDEEAKFAISHRMRDLLQQSLGRGAFGSDSARRIISNVDNGDS